MKPRSRKLINSTIRQLNAENITKRKQYPRTDIGQFNCWGFTAAMLGWRKKVRWIHSEEMEKILEEMSIPTKNPKTGDVAVFRSYHGVLMHTAILLDNKTMIHKNGTAPIEVIGLNYSSYGAPTEIRQRKER